MSGEYEQRKARYDQINAGYESNRSQLEAVIIIFRFFFLLFGFKFLINFI